MPSSWSTLKIELIADGEQTGTWGQTTNNNLGGVSTGSRGLEQAVVGMATLVTGDFTANSYTLPYNDTNDTQDFRALVLNITATLSATGQVIVPAIEKPYIVMNNSSGGYAVTVKNSAGTGITVPSGKTMWVYNNGTNVVDVVTHLSSLTLGSALPVASGGTGGTTESAARTGLGATTVGSNLFTLTNPSAIRFLRVNADNTVSALSDSDFRTAIGAGTGNGTVTSVGGTGTVNGITLTGTVTSSGNLTLGGTLTGVNLTTQVTGTLPVANGGTGATTFTASSYLKGNGTSAIQAQTGIPAGDITSGTLGVARGGTGGTTFTANNVLLGNGTSAFQVVAPGTNGNVLTSNGTTWTSAAPSGITTGKAIAMAIVFG